MPCYIDMDKHLIQLYIIAISTISVSCNNFSRKEGGQQESTMVNTDGMDETAKSSIDVPITVSLAHTEDEYLKQLNPAEYIIVSENDKYIFIDNNLEYYNNYMSGKRFSTPLDNVLCTEGIEYLTLYLDIVNNTNQKLDISEMNLYVEESKPDSIPFIYIRTSNDRSNSISFINGSWFN